LAPFVAPYLDDTAARIVDAVTTAADGLAVTALQVALAWVRDRPGVTAPVVGARTAQQLAAALSVEALTLPDEICRALDDVSAPVHRHPEHDWSTQCARSRPRPRRTPGRGRRARRRPAGSRAHRTGTPGPAGTPPPRPRTPTRTQRPGARRPRAHPATG